MAAASTFYTTSFSTFSMSSRQLQSHEEEKEQEEEIEKQKGEDGQRQCRQIDIEENMKDHDNIDDNKNDNSNNNDQKNIKIDDYNVTTTISSYLPLLPTSSSSTSTSKAIPTSTQAPTSEQSEPSGQIPVPSPPIVMVPPGRIIHIYKENGKNVSNQAVTFE